MVGCRSGLRPGRLWKGREALAAAQHAVQDDGQFAGHGDDGSLASALGQLQAPSAQVRIGAETAQDVLGRLHQQTAEIGIAGAGDAPSIRLADLPILFIGWSPFAPSSALRAA